VTAAALAALLAGCSPNARWVAVTGDADGTVVTLDGTGATVDTFRVATAPAMANRVAYGRDGASLLVLSAAPPASLLRMQRDGGRVLSSYGLEDPGAAFLLDHKGRRAFVARGPVVEAIWLADGTRLRVLDVCRDASVALVPFHEARRLFVICRQGEVTEVDTRLETVLRTNTPSEDAREQCDATGGALSSNGSILFVMCRDPGRILYLDRVTLTVLGTMELDAPGGTFLASEGRGVVLSEDTLLLVDLARRTVTARIALSAPARDMVAAADGRLLVLVGHERTSQILAFDPATTALTPFASFGSPMQSLSAWPEATPVFNW
jgi:hypothetical protein